MVTASDDPALAEDRRRLEAAIATQLGSTREARWIVEAAGTTGARALADRRAAGEPLQYVLGRWPFRHLELTVDARVLVPRPETEQVVEVALDELRRTTATRGARSDDPPVCVDLGTGSGAIALSMALEGGGPAGRPEVWATDASADALAVARINLAELVGREPAAAERVELVSGWWYDALPTRLAGRIDLVVSNPPYVGSADYPDLDPGVRQWEPRLALVADRGRSGVDGMAAIEEIVAAAPRWLRPTGALVVEIDPSQAYAAIDVARRAGFGRVTTARDLAGRLRVLVAGR
jgi:release factor glutamine methyltransferase